MSKIHILLSTYNGESYLIPQLDSIFKQTFQDFTLYVRDDGSTDSTYMILRNYIAHHPEYEKQIVLLENPQNINLGYMDSFWLLLKSCPGADYYAFCDQDDVWLPSKLENGIKLLNAESSKIPALYFSNFFYCNEALEPLHEALKPSLPITLKDVLFYTPAFGFTIMINEALRSLALQVQIHHLLPHDGWLQKTAAAFGKIIYSPLPAAYYRRHDSAVTVGNKNLFALIRNWIKNEIFGSAMKENHFVITRFFEEYAPLLEKHDSELLSVFADNSNSFCIWWKRLFYPICFRPTLGGNLALRICFLLNRY